MRDFQLFLLFLLIGCDQSPSQKTFIEDNSDEPMVFAPGQISTSEYHESMNALSPDAKTIYFTRSDQSFKTSTLYSSRFDGAKWSKPQTLPFSGTFYDAGLSFAADSDLAFFTSKRSPGQPNLSPEWNIWKVAYDGETWGQPEVLPPPVNSDSLECCLTINQNGLAYFSSNREGSWDIYETKYADGNFTEAKKLNATINSPFDEWPGYINETGDLLLLSSIRERGLGGDDIYLARKTGNQWTELILLGKGVNSSSYEDSPSISPDGKYLYFSSWRDTNNSSSLSNIHYIELDKALEGILK